MLEETGFDCESRLLEHVYMTSQGKDNQTITLFVVANVPEDFQFMTRTRKEISVSILNSISDDRPADQGFHIEN